MACSSKGPGPGAYLLPTLVGYNNHDVTRQRNPAYTMGVSTHGTRAFVGPGPQYYLQRNLTRYGRNGVPAYTIRPRLKGGREDQKPGPGAHSPELCPLMREKRAPAFSMGKRTSGFRGDVIPAPNNYELPRYLGPNQVVKTSGAAYSMGKRIAGSCEYKSPGPANYNPSQLDKYKKNSPAYSLKARVFPPGGRTQIPGPDVYYPDFVTGRNQPKFSFGTRHGECVEPLVLESDN